jgi:16S rRNA (cytosine1402-N4)-methyltransferase
LPAALHIPVLLEEVMEALAPIGGGVFIDGTFGAGGYSQALLERGAAQVIAIDRDPEALAAGADLAGASGGRLVLVSGVFAEMDQIAAVHAAGPVAGVVLDIGVSSMQIDQAGRGFSFMRDGPLDMRMAQDGPSASDLVNRAGERRGASRGPLSRRGRKSRSPGPAGWPKSWPAACRASAQGRSIRRPGPSRPCGSL